MNRYATIAAASLCLAAVENAGGEDVSYDLSGIESRVAALGNQLIQIPSATHDSVVSVVGRETSDDAAVASYLVMAPERSLEDRLKTLESESKKQAAAAAKKKADDEKKPTQRWTGRIHADYWAFPHTSAGANAFETGDAADSVQDRVLFRRLRIGIQGTIPDNMQYKLEVDFNTPNNPQLKDDFIGWQELPVLQTLLIGNQKRPYGLDHIHSTRYTIFMERPAIIEAFNQDSRRFGIQSWGVSEDEAYNWRYGVFKSQDIQNLGTVLSTPVVEDYQAEIAGRFANTIWYDEGTDGRGYAHWAIAGTAASTDPTGPITSTAHFQTRPEARTENRWLDTGVIAGADAYQLMGLEGVFNYGPLHIESEYQQVWMQRVSDPGLQFSGGYVYVAWFLTGEHMPWDRQTGQLARAEPFTNFFRVRTTDGTVNGGWGAWQVGARYSHADLSDQNIHGGIMDNMTFSLAWYFNAHSKMIFNCSSGEIHDRRPADGQTAANFTVLGTRLVVDF